MMALELDKGVRIAAFDFLTEQRRLHGEELPQSLLRQGFMFQGTRVPLWSPQGIFKPAILQMPLTIRTAPVLEGMDRPYEDEVEENGRIKYRYRGSSDDRMHPDNVGLRQVMERGRPLIYLYGVDRGRYSSTYPVYIVADDPEALCFTMVADVQVRWTSDGNTLSDPAADGRRLYHTSLTVRRLHQQKFRARVLRAYHERCAICRLRHRELLEAAHILPDGHPRGAPIVPNGLALCRLHHGAFDGNILGVRPDLVIELQPKILKEEDGPMLVHGLQGFHRQLIHVPKSDDLKPGREFLEERYEIFRKAG